MDRPEAEALFANDTFYSLFSAGDQAGMRRFWSNSHRISCIHPLGELIRGRYQVMDSWDQILAQGELDIRAKEAQTSIIGGVAIITCIEVLNGHGLVATNVLCQEEDQWKMIHHQAGPCANAIHRDEGGISHLKVQ